MANDKSGRSLTSQFEFLQHFIPFILYNNQILQIMIFTIYVAGVILAFALGLLDLYYTKMHTVIATDDRIIIPIMLSSWISVVLLLVYRNDQIVWSINHLVRHND